LFFVDDARGRLALLRRQGTKEPVGYQLRNLLNIMIVINNKAALDKNAKIGRQGHLQFK